MLLLAAVAAAAVPVRAQTDPQITITARRDTIIAGMEDLVLKATREAPLDERLPLSVKLTQSRAG